MLDFFRRYQRYFFLMITVVIIISFSFFGTYSTLGSNVWREKIAFTAIDGREITRLDVEEMDVFLATDNSDKLTYGGAWGPNFLNDGVIRKNFLETGLAQELISAYSSDLQTDLNQRLVKEKKYTPYAHPQAPFINIENIWNYFSPNITTHFNGLRSADSAVEREAINHRVQLYLAQQKIPQNTLKQLLIYQEKQYEWLTPDPSIYHKNLVLFGYQTIENWFGSAFSSLVSEFIINAAILAESRGYKVSTAEALSDLMHNTQMSYQQNQNNPNLGVTSPQEYFNEQLNRMHIEYSRAVKIWQQVLLFRRLFQDASASAIIDDLPSKHLNQFAYENVTVDLYRLPPGLQLDNLEALQNFEVYLQAVSKVDEKKPLQLPTKFIAVDEVVKNYPELVQKRYLLEIAKVTQKQLLSHVNIRELWNWEADEKNWEVLREKFPEIGLSAIKDRKLRVEALDDLEQAQRARIDNFAKEEIIKLHPEWINQALDKEKPQTQILALRLEGGKAPLEGLDKKSKRQELMQLLDTATVGTDIKSDSPLYNYSVDNKTFYRLAVLERTDSLEVLNFTEAVQANVLGVIGNRILEKFYITQRTKSPSIYQDANGALPDFKNVRETVIEQFLQSVKIALQTVQNQLSPTQKALITEDQQRLASLRFYPHVTSVEQQLKKLPEQSDNQLVKSINTTAEEKTSLLDRTSILDQWKLEKQTLTVDRQTSNQSIDLHQALILNVGDWSSPTIEKNGQVHFFYVKEKGVNAELNKKQTKQILAEQSLLGAEAQRQLMQQILKMLQEKNALSLNYLKNPPSEGDILQQTATIEMNNNN